MSEAVMSVAPAKRVSNGELVTEIYPPKYVYPYDVFCSECDGSWREWYEDKHPVDIALDEEDGWEAARMHLYHVHGIKL